MRLRIGGDPWGAKLRAAEAEIRRLVEQNSGLSIRLQEAWARIEGVEHAAAAEAYEVEQTIAAAFPGEFPRLPPDADTLDRCVGEHVPSTLAARAVREIADLRTRLTDVGEIIRVGAGQFQEAVELLREARQYVPEATGCADDIDGQLPAITAALADLAALVAIQRQAEAGP